MKESMRKELTFEINITWLCWGRQFFWHPYWPYLLLFVKLRKKPRPALSGSPPYVHIDHPPAITHLKGYSKFVKSSLEGVWKLPGRCCEDVWWSLVCDWKVFKKCIPMGPQKGMPSSAVVIGDIFLVDIGGHISFVIASPLIKCNTSGNIYHQFQWN